MDDRFLESLRADPDAGFATALRERLQGGERRASRAASAWRPAMALAAAAAVVAALFVFPSLRVSAEAVLDLFRVRNFAAVPFDPARLEKLRSGRQENPLLLFGDARTLQDPGEPESVADLGAATARAGIAVRTPSFLPHGLKLERVSVEGPAAARVTADVAKVRDVLATLDIRDLDVPQDLDGKSVTVRKPPVVIQAFRSERWHANLIQARSPDVELPAGVDLARLAEIGMRIIGVDRGEAHRLAGSIDWHTTLLVPVPPNAGSFRSVDVNGNHGLLITTRGDASSGGRREPSPEEPQIPRNGSVVMWSENDRVFALTGDFDDVALLQMAQSVR